MNKLIKDFIHTNEHQIYVETQKGKTMVRIAVWIYCPNPASPRYDKELTIWIRHQRIEDSNLQLYLQALTDRRHQSPNSKSKHHLIMGDTDLSNIKEYKRYVMRTFTIQPLTYMYIHTHISIKRESGIQTYMVDMYAKWGSTDKVLELFDKMPQRNEVSCTTSPSLSLPLSLYLFLSIHTYMLEAETRHVNCLKKCLKEMWFPNTPALSPSFFLCTYIVGCMQIVEA